MVCKKMDDLIFDYNKLKEIASKNNTKYISAKPFPHIVIDNFISEAILEKLISEFPSPATMIKWRKVEVKNDEGKMVQTKKLGFNDETQLKPTLRHFFWELNSAHFLKFLEELTGIKNLISDPHLIGGGIHQSLPGAILGVHADFNTHKLWKLDRRINFLLYLNKDWKEEYGGHVELWTAEMDKCVHKLAPIANRCVIFNTSETSFHGHPSPLNCPQGMTRKSIAMYYYSNGRPEGEKVSTRSQTIWK